MIAPPDTVKSLGVPNKPGFYWRRVWAPGDDGIWAWRWRVAEVYRLRVKPGSLMMTNGYAADDSITWGPRIQEPADPLPDHEQADLARGAAALACIYEGQS